MTAEPRRPGRPRGTRRDPAERRAELLGHAEDAIRRHGVDVSMGQIAEQAGVAKATLYDNFDGKPGLTDALLDRYGARVLRAMARGLDRPLSGREIVRGGIGIFVGFIEADPEIYRFIVVNAAGGSVVEETAAPLTALIGTGLRQAGSDSGSAEPVAHALLGALFASAEWWAQHRTMSRADFVDYLVAFLWSGLVGLGLSDTDDPIDVSGLARVIAEVPGVLDPPDAEGDAP